MIEDFSDQSTDDLFFWGGQTSQESNTVKHRKHQI